ncbi:hypothetical protein MNBD_ACTINO01-428 [hydrothermal vent metagenome]|uniref:Uncharacterized protein n=1 Tax=hydrothermal vent metagenome TaxID=652676 RepID=A0A3B0STL1_9ZZZZ
MKQTFMKLPGPIPVKVVLAVIIVVIALFVLNAVYNWMGNFLDSGGTIS